MIQQSNFNLKCEQDDHKDEIETVCYNQYCTEFRLNCFQCMKKCSIHRGYCEEIKKINTLMNFIDSQNIECDNLINDLNTYVYSLNQSFTLLKMGIRNKYSLSRKNYYIQIQQLNQLSINNQSQQSFQNRLRNQLIHLIIYTNNDNYHNLIIIRLMIILLNYVKSYMIKVMIQRTNIKSYLLYIGEINMLNQYYIHEVYPHYQQINILQFYQKNQ
ncbi:unnamed protein product [Paramecium pentaurelia]|uniref:Uncharacterized protein n=1 Tax=Paramecium pentaurelia TaxID=43138 RepID=A0A8S1WEB6_9CILI|nr:unnamed protein product [Paramecium pentaurelia]